MYDPVPSSLRCQAGCFRWKAYSSFKAVRERGGDISLLMLKLAATGVDRKWDTHLFVFLAIWDLCLFHIFFNMGFKSTSPVLMRCLNQHILGSCDRDQAFPLIVKERRWGSSFVLPSALFQLTVTCYTVWSEKARGEKVRLEHEAGR